MSNYLLSRKYEDTRCPECSCPLSYDVDSDGIDSYLVTYCPSAACPESECRVCGETLFRTPEAELYGTLEGGYRCLDCWGSSTILDSLDDIGDFGPYFIEEF